MGGAEDIENGTDPLRVHDTSAIEVGEKGRVVIRGRLRSEAATRLGSVDTERVKSNQDAVQDMVEGVSRGLGSIGQFGGQNANLLAGDGTSRIVRQIEQSNKLLNKLVAKQQPAVA